MSIKTSILSAALGLAALPLVLACADSPVEPQSGDGTPAAYMNVTPRNVEVRVGGTAQLTATIRSADGEVLNHGVRWSSSDAGVATVYNGRVYGKRLGTVIITADCAHASGWTEVTVSKLDEREDDVDDSVR